MPFIYKVVSRLQVVGNRISEPSTVFQSPPSDCLSPSWGGRLPLHNHYTPEN